MDLYHPLAKIIAENGVDKVNTSMFSEEQKKEIYSQAAEILFRLNKTEEGFIALDKAGMPMPVDRLKKLAENKIALGQHRAAYDFLIRAGQKEMAEFVKLNFL
jgi:hypothetical protein